MTDGIVHVRHSASDEQGRWQFKVFVDHRERGQGHARSARGAGKLGIAIARAIIEGHKDSGDITVKKQERPFESFLKERVVRIERPKNQRRDDESVYLPVFRAPHSALRVSVSPFGTVSVSGARKVIIR